MSFNVFIRLMILACLWGPAFLLVKVAVQDIPPLTLAAARVSIAATILYLVLRMQRRRLPGFGPIWKHFAITALFFNALPYALLSWGEQHIDSAPASILMGTEPLFVIILAHLFTSDDRLTAAKAVGVLVGFAGLSLLFAPALSSGVQATTWGLLAATLAAASYAIGTVYAKQTLSNLPPLVGPTAQLGLAAVYLVPLALLVEQPYAQAVPSWSAMGALLILAVVCTVLTFVLYYRVMERASATHLSMITYMVPIVGTLLGVVVLQEQPGWSAYLGCGLIFLGIMGVNGTIQPVHRRRLTNAVTRP